METCGICNWSIYILMLKDEIFYLYTTMGKWGLLLALNNLETTNIDTFV